MSRPSKIAIVKELGSRRPRCLAAHAVRGQDEPELVVVERYPASMGEENLLRLEEDTKSLIGFDHTNVATLIWSVRLKGDVAVLSEWIDGESLESALGSPSKPPADMLVRVVVDVCEALAALDAFDGGKHVCGSLGPDDVFLSVDGVTRITRFNLGRIPIESLGEKRRASMAPEYVRGERTPRADVYVAGKLLETCAPGDAALAPVIARATAEDPAARFGTTKELAQAITAATKVVARAIVSQYVARTFGQLIESRLGKLEPKVGISLSMTPPPMSLAPPAVEPPKMTAPEPVKVEAPKPEPEVKPIKKEKEVVKIAASPVARKPDAAVIAKKVVPLPKPKIESTPKVEAAPKVVLAKTNGTPTKTAVAPKPAPAPLPPPMPIDVPITISEPPPSAREELDLDIDFASVRPPPMIREEPKKEEPPPPVVVVERAKSIQPPKSVRPPAKSVRPPKSMRPAAAVGVDDDVFTPKRSPYRGPLLVLAALVIAAASFAAGRMTAPDPWPATPAGTTPSATPTPTPTPTPSLSATSTSAAPSTSASTRAPAAHPSGRYSPSAI